MKHRDVLCYLAGVVDSDGCISITRRTNSAKRWSYYPRVQVTQVEPEAVKLFKATFGGNLHLNPPTKPTRRPIFVWQATCRLAVYAAKALLPYLRIKRKQAQLIIRFGDLMADHKLRKRSTWYTAQKTEETYSAAEAAETKMVGRDSVYQAIRNGSVPVIKKGRRIAIPRRFWDAYTIRRGQHPLPAEYIALRQTLWQEAKWLNRVGPR